MNVDVMALKMDGATYIQIQRSNKESTMDQTPVSGEGAGKIETSIRQRGKVTRDMENPTESEIKELLLSWNSQTKKQQTKMYVLRSDRLELAERA